MWQGCRVEAESRHALDGGSANERLNSSRHGLRERSSEAPSDGEIRYQGAFNQSGNWVFPAENSLCANAP